MEGPQQFIVNLMSSMDESEQPGGNGGNRGLAGQDRKPGVGTLHWTKCVTDSTFVSMTCWNFMWNSNMGVLMLTSRNVNNYQPPKL